MCPSLRSHRIWHVIAGEILLFCEWLIKWETGSNCMKDVWPAPSSIWYQQSPDSQRPSRGQSCPHNGLANITKHLLWWRERTRFKIFSDILTACWSSSLTPPLPVERCQLMMSRNDDKSELMTVQLTSSLGTFSDGRLAILTWGRHYQLYLATFSLNHQWTRRVKQVSKVDWIQLWIL